MDAASQADHPLTERLGVTELPPRMKRTPPQTPTEPIQPTRPEPETEWRNPALIETLIRLAGHALSARALLLLAIMGGFVLAVMAMNGAQERLFVLVAYSVLTVIPVVILEIRKR